MRVLEKDPGMTKILVLLLAIIIMTLNDGNGSDKNLQTHLNVKKVWWKLTENNDFVKNKSSLLKKTKTSDTWKAVEL